MLIGALELEAAFSGGEEEEAAGEFSSYRAF